jgi:uncharacterized membrane protein YdjX (TVP38/TMEM64 family)
MGRRSAAVSAVGKRRLQRALVLWLGLLIGWQIASRRSGLGTTALAQRFVDRVGHAWWGVAAYVGVYLARPLVLFPASILTVAGGLIFGPVVGIIVVVVAANASALVAYGVGRSLSVTSQSGRESLISRWAGRMRSNSFETVLIMRMVFLPYDLVSYISGGLRIRVRSFLGATALGSLPGTVSFVLLGASLERLDRGIKGLDHRVLAGSVALFLAGLAVSRWLKHRTADERLATERKPS